MGDTRFWRLATPLIALIFLSFGCSEPAKVDLTAVKEAAKPSRVAEGSRGLHRLATKIKPKPAQNILRLWAKDGGRLAPRSCKDPLPISKLNALVRTALLIKPVEAETGEAIALLAERLRTNGITMAEVLTSAAIGARLRATGFKSDTWKPGPEDDRRIIAVAGVCFVEGAQMAKATPEAEAFVAELWEGAMQHSGAELQTWVENKVKEAQASSTKYLQVRVPKLGMALKQMQRVRGSK